MLTWSTSGGRGAVELAIDRIGDVVVVALPVEELSAAHTGEFKREIASSLDEHLWIVLNLSRVRFVDSSGLGAFIWCLRRLNTRGGDLKLCGMSEHVRAVFETVRLHRVFDIYDTPEEAAHAFER
jgi:anti-sigma B factor antagonist